jgi:hypothetical protein
MVKMTSGRQQTPTHLFKQLIEAAKINMWAFSAQGIANTLWALAKLRSDDGGADGSAARKVAIGDVLGALVGRAEAKMGDFNAQNVANTVWALAKLRSDDDGADGSAARKVAIGSVLGALVGRAEAKMGDCNAQGIANTLWALAKLRSDDGGADGSAARKVAIGGVLGALVGRAEAKMGDFNAQGIANTLWALAKLRSDDGGADGSAAQEVAIGGVLGALVRRAEAKMGDFNAQNVANTLWALAKLRSDESIDRYRNILSALAERSLVGLGDLNAMEICMCLRACYSFCMKGPAAHLLGRLRELWDTTLTADCTGDSALEGSEANAFVSGFKFAGLMGPVGDFNAFDVAIEVFDQCIPDNQLCAAVLDVYRKHDAMTEHTRAAKMWDLLVKVKADASLDAATIFQTWASDLSSGSNGCSPTSTTPLNLLFVFGCPTSRDSIKHIIAEIDHATKCVEGCCGAATSTVIFHSGAELRKVLRGSRHFDLVHIACHVENDVFALERADGTQYSLPTTILANWLQGQVGGVPSVLVLNGCSTLNAVDSYRNLQQAETYGLAQQVVCWDGEVLDDAAALYSRGFYSHLQATRFESLRGDHSEIEAAFAEAVRHFKRRFHIGQTNCVPAAVDVTGPEGRAQRFPNGGNPQLVPSISVDNISPASAAQVSSPQSGAPSTTGAVSTDDTTADPLSIFGGAPADTSAALIFGGGAATTGATAPPEFGGSSMPGSLPSTFVGVSADATMPSSPNFGATARPDNTMCEKLKGGKPVLLQHEIAAESQEVDAHVLPKPPASNNFGSEVTNAASSHGCSGAVCSADGGSVIDMHMLRTAGGGGSGGSDCSSLSTILGECRVGSTNISLTSTNIIQPILISFLGHLCTTDIPECSQCLRELVACHGLPVVYQRLHYNVGCNICNKPNINLHELFFHCTACARKVRRNAGKGWDCCFGCARQLALSLIHPR